MASKSPIAVAAALQAVSGGLNATIDEGLLIEAAAFEPVCVDDEARGQLRRFLKRRET